MHICALYRCKKQLSSKFHFCSGKSGFGAQVTEDSRRLAEVRAPKPLVAGEDSASPPMEFLL